MIPNFIIKLLFLMYGTLCPGYKTYLQLTTKGVVECTGWVKYWIIYAIVVGIWSLTDIVFFWMPLYEEIKLAFMLLLCISPPSGSAALFDVVAFPLMNRYKKTLEKNETKYELGNVMLEVFLWMGHFILLTIINTIRVHLYPVIISKERSIVLKSHHNKMRMTARIEEIEEYSSDEWEDALDAQLPEVNDEATHFESNSFLHGSEPIYKDAKRNIDNGNNNSMV